MPTEEMYVSANTSYANLLDYAAKENLDNDTFNRLVWAVLDKSPTKTKRTFAYGETLAASETHCTPSFARSFVHIDWIDGESVVQAEETSIEEGFNSRFHKIEDDFDNLKADVVKLFGCLAELRSDLAARLEEIRLELNRINTDIADCCNSDSGTVIPWNPYDPRFPYYPDYPHGYPPMTYPDPKGPIINPPNTGYPAYPGYVDFGPDYYRNFRYGQGYPVLPWMTNTTPYEADPGSILRSTSEPDIAIVAGMQGRRISTDVFNGKQVEVWSTPAGVMITPFDASQGKLGRESWVNPHIDGAGMVLGWALRNGERIAKTMGDRAFTVDQFGKAFGDERLADGRKLSTWLDQLPSGVQIKDAQQIGQMVVDRAAANVRRDRTGNETVIGLVGLSGEGNSGKLGLAALRSVPTKVVEELKGMGIATVNDLAQADPQAISRTLGANAPLESAANWNAQAKVLSGLMIGGG